MEFTSKMCRYVSFVSCYCILLIFSVILIFFMGIKFREDYYSRVFNFEIFLQ